MTAAPPPDNAFPAIPVVTVDGPSGVGKGLVTRWLAARLGYHRLDSGALYRILALAAQGRGIPLEQHENVAALASALDIRFAGDSEHDEQIWVDGQDLTQVVRAESTGALASQIATAPAVRAALLQRQRDFRRAPGLIADGRDMGTVVFPDAGLKLFLEAAPEERAKRRHAQLQQMGQSARIDDLCEEIRARDERDRNRPIAPARPADDAHLLDTTGLTPQQVYARLESLL